MQEQRSSSPGGWVSPLAAGILFAAVTYPAIQNWRADRWINSTQPRDWERAVRIQPGNAEYWDRLGRYRQLDFEGLDLAKAVEYYRKATQIDPSQANYWLDLATAYESLGESAPAREAFLRAKENYPLSSEVAWHFGNFLLRQGQVREALTEIHRAVAGDPTLVPLAASRAWRATGDMSRVLAEVIPATREAYLSALDAFVIDGALDPALAVWKQLIKLNQPIELERVNRFVEDLAAANRVEDAQEVWHEAEVLSGVLPRGTREFPLVTNGGFEQDATNGGFDWRILPVAGVEYDFDATVMHSGARSLRITFDGKTNVDFVHVGQRVPVQPHTRYRLAAFFRTESVTTDSGICLLILHPSGEGTPDVRSPDLTDTQPWKPSEVEFTTGPATRLLDIRLRRAPSTKLDSKIRGTVWVDDVTLVPLSGGGVPGAGR
jgi:hypothetical protein